MSERLVRALGDPLRRRLLFAYSVEAINPAALAQRLDEPVNRVAYHTGILAKHGFVNVVRTERRRGALTRFYRTTAPLELAGAAWESLPVDVRRALALGALEEALTQARRAALDGGFELRSAHLTRMPLMLDDEGVDAVARLLETAKSRIQTLAAECRGRRPPATRSYEVVALAYDRRPGP